MTSQFSQWKLYPSSCLIVNRLKEKGVIYCLKAGASIIYRRYFEALIRFISQLGNLMSWNFPSLRRFLPFVPQSDKRILAIWDFRVVPFSYGDILWLCQETALVMRELHKVDKIDIALLCDVEHVRADGGMDAQNFHYYFSKLLPLAFINPHLGALLVMDSPDMLTKYIADNHERYYIFPPYIDSKGRSLTKYEQYFNYVQTFYFEHGFVPYLSCQPAMVMWARQFLATLVRPHLPVTVHLRNTSTDISRNTQLECWLEFFSFCQTRYDVTFILIGAKDEIDQRFRGMSNVLIAKDHGTTAEQDMALIQAAMFYMGKNSGPACMACLSDLPYVIYGWIVIHEKLIPGQPLPWATPLQKLVWEAETTEKLIADFTWLYEQMDTAQWAFKFDQLAIEAISKLKRHQNFNGVVLEGLGKKKEHEK